MSTSYIQQVQESLRLQQVYNVFFRYGWDMALDRWPTANAFRQMMQKWIWRLPDDVDLGDVTTPAKIRMMFEELGPTYVKVGQIISSQSSSLPAEWNEELAKLQSSVPAFPSDQVREVIMRELKAPPEEIYASFSPEPFAAASTAQVHRATLKDGTEVVVKVQRPGIQKQMRADIGIMRNATRVLAGRVEAVRAVDLPGMVDQFGTGALRELDYTG
jgi:ubiquinone biosynthesis protein